MKIVDEIKTYFYFRKRKSKLNKSLHKILSAKFVSENKKFYSSKDEYDQYDDREMMQFEHGNCRALVNGYLQELPFSEVRNAYLDSVYRVISENIKSNLENRKIRILEVGCGNGTNLMLLNSAFGDAVELSGVDISAERIKRGTEYWGRRLGSATLSVADATEMNGIESNSYDVVYSICALEQINDGLARAVSGMARISKSDIVFVEPVFEYGNEAQRLYSLVANHCRNLLSLIMAQGLDVVEARKMNILHNPLNPVGVVRLKK
ncbi:class I SAM-dependent methyltransferase [Radicibacter daui]|uniref:class I SAM-dependent methyltransferase n=1 Tax=Radicibacter daui TaxID=3064829 RepID=UPI004046BF0B